MESDESLFTVNFKVWEEFQFQLSKETDRGAALMGAAFLEHLLGALIEEFILDNPKISKKLLKGPTAPLGGFYSRIIASYSLGLISEDELNDLNIIRDIRNDFAHKVSSMSFSVTGVKNKLKKLCIPYLAKGISDTTTLMPRQLFINSVFMISTFLDERRKHIGSDKRQPAKKFIVLDSGMGKIG